MSQIGVVVIGRNEGERLTRCLLSLGRERARGVYVDSGSADASVGTARSMGWQVVELDQSLPFSAARGRNEGFQALLRAKQEIEFVQFVDGDCELEAGWLELGRQTLEAHPDVAAVCGRIRERNARTSIYRRLCDVEWSKPVGQVKACTGIAMIRAEAFRQVNGFDPKVMGAEDGELCLRLRRKRWKILRLETDMVLHDSDMTRFSQWWRRSVRAGHGFAQGMAMHGGTPERHFKRECRSTLLWGFILPLLMVSISLPTHGLSFLLALLYPLQAWRISASLRRRGIAPAESALYAGFCVVGMLPTFLGMLLYYVDTIRGRQGRLIEHKKPPKPSLPGVNPGNPPPA